MSELAVRSSNLLEIKLESLGEKLLISVTELGEPRFTLETEDGKEALDMYYHPFAYYKDSISPPRQAMNELWPDTRD